MWKFEYRTIGEVRAALASARMRAEADLAARSLSSIKIRKPVLYIVYLRGFPVGPFSIKEPYEWPGEDLGSMKAVAGAAFSLPAAQALYAHHLLSAKTRQGLVLSPAGRVDLLLGRRIATALPQDHPALARPPNLETVDPVLFYDEPEDAEKR